MLLSGPFSAKQQANLSEFLDKVDDFVTIAKINLKASGFNDNGRKKIKFYIM